MLLYGNAGRNALSYVVKITPSTSKFDISYRTQAEYTRVGWVIMIHTILITTVFSVKN